MSDEKEQKIVAALTELLNLQTANVTQSSKTQARKKIIEFLTMDHELNWQCVATPYDIVNEMLDLIPSDAKKFIVFFSLEFIEEMVKTRGIAPESILFIGDNDMESAVAGNKDMYGVHTAIMSKENGYQDGKLIFPEIIFNFLNNEDNMKFEKLAVIGNPPYQTPDAGNSTGAKPLYHKFIESAIDGLNPDYISMIVPSRWMVGGKGLDTFRERMMNDRSLKKIVHFGGDKEIFPTVSIKGGVTYFIWSKDHNEECEFVNGNSTTKRFLNSHDIIIQDNNAFSIIEKVLNNSSKWVSETCLARKPFGLRTNFNDFKDTGVKCICQGKKEKFVDPNAFTDKNNVLGKWKVCTSKGASGSYLSDVRGGLVTFVLEPNTVCLETYIVVNAFDTKIEADNFNSYMNTKFFRFILGTRVSGLDINKEKFAWVPDLEDYSAPWTDKELYAKYNLTRQEVAYIESKIKAI